jgi:hypothetical protein
LFDSSGINAYQGNVDIQLDLLVTGSSCVIYREEHLNVDVDATDTALDGIFSLKLGGGSLVAPWSVTNITPLFSSGSLAGYDENGAVDGINCPAVAANGSQREVRVRVRQASTGSYETLGPGNLVITSVPGALVAETLQGKLPTEFIQTSANITQGNIESLVNGSNADALHHHDQYVPLGGSSGVTGTILNTGSFYGTTSTSKVGIGTNNALVGDLEIWKTNPQIYLNSAGTGGTNSVTFSAGGTQRGRIETGSSDGMKFYSGSQLALEIDSSENLFVTGSLDVGGTVSVGQYPVDPSLTAGHAGTVWYNSASNNLKMWNGVSALNVLALGDMAPASQDVLKWNGSAWMASADQGITALTGDVTASGSSGSVNTVIVANAVTSAKINSAFASNMLLSTNATTGDSVTYVGCALNQIMTFDAAGKWSCTTVNSLLTSIAPTQISQHGANSQEVLKWNGAAWIPGLDADSGGDITDVTVGYPVLGGGSILSVSIGVDVGVNAGQLVQVAAGNKLPVIDGSQLTDVNATKLNGQIVSGTAPSPNQVLKWNGSQWQGGTLSAAEITGLGTAAYEDIGTGADEIPQLDSMGRMPSVDGSQLSNINAISINGQPVWSAGAGPGQILEFNGSAWILGADDAGGGGITTVQAGTGIFGGGTSSIVTINLANTAVSAASYGGSSMAASFTVDAQGRLTAASEVPVNALIIGGRNISSAAPVSPSQVLKWNGSQWQAGDINYGDLLSLPGINFNYKPNDVACTATQVLKWNGSYWECGNDNSGGAAVTQVDIGPGLAGSTITSTGSIYLPVTAVTASSYGSPSSVATFTVDERGRLTAAASAAIALPTNQINQQGANGGEVLAWNGSAWMPAASSSGDITSVNVVAPLLGGSLSGGVTLSLDVGYTANKIPQYDSSGFLAIGTASVTAGAVLDIWGDTAANSAVLLPRATTSARPTTGVDGMIRYNTSLAKFEVYENGDWYNMATGSTADNLGNHTATTQILATTGTAATPGYAFSGATDTGFYLKGTNEVVTIAGGTEVLQVNPTSIRPQVAVIGRFAQGPYLSMASTPSATDVPYTFYGDENTGLYSSGADTLSLVTNAAERLTIDNQGHVGIGTTGPTYSLNVVPSANTGVGILIDKFDGSEGGELVLNGNDRAWHFDNLNGNLRIMKHAGNDGTFMATPMTFGLNGDVTVEGTTFKNGGLVGIGIPSPAVELEVAGTGAILIPRNTSAVRPAGINGMIRYNTDSQKFEVYEGRWQNMLSSVVSGAADNLGNHTATQQILATPGTGAAPSYSFNGDVDTGFSTAGPNQIAISSAGTERIRMDVTGNVGIGTTLPSEKLDVVGANAAEMGIRIHNTDGGSNAEAGIWTENDIGARGWLGIRSSNWSGYWGGVDANDVYVDSNDSLGLVAREDIKFATAWGTPMERMRIMTDGKVGIGTTAPQAALDIVGSATISAILIPRDSQSLRPSGLNGMIRYNTTSLKFEVYEGRWQNMVSAGGAGAADNMGNGVATTQVQAIIGTANSPGYTFAGDLDTGISTAGPDKLVFSAAGVEVMRMNHLGQVGIGTQMPNSPLHIYSLTGPPSGTVFNTHSNLWASPAGMGTSTQYFASRAEVNATNDVAYAAGVYGSVDGGADTAFGLKGSVSNMSGSTITGYGVYGESEGGSYTTAHGGFFQVNAGGNTNGFGVRIGIVTGTNRWGVYSESNASNYFGGRVGIGSTSPIAELDVAGAGAIVVPRNTSAVRPSGINGMIRYNTTTLKFEVYEGRWQNMVSAGGGSGDNLGDHSATSAILAITGTAASPSVSFLNGSNRGMYALGTGGLAFSTGSTPRITVLANGNVGFNQPDPTERIDVLGKVRSQYFSASTGGTVNNSYQFWNDSDTGMFSPGVNIIGFSTANTQRMRIDSIGRVAIGSLAPNADLDVMGSGAILVPRAGTADRPSTAINGMIRYNTNSARFEAFENGAWINISPTGAGTGDFMANGSVPMTGAFRSIAGAVGTPGITFAGDTDNGVWSPAADNFSISTSGSERIRITDTGNVGIGINSPTDPLHVYKNQDGQTAIVVQNQNAFTGSQAAFEAVANSGSISMGIGSNGYGQPELQNKGFLKTSSGTVGMTIWHEGNGDLVVYNGSTPTERMRIQNNGQVGIGAAPLPGALLDLNGVGTGASSFIVPRDTEANRPSTGINGMIRYNTDLLKFEVYEGRWQSMIVTGGGGTSQWTASGSDIYYNSGGVGIGTTAPAAKLHVAVSGAGLSWATTGGLVVQHSGSATDYTGIDVISGSTGTGSLRFGHPTTTGGIISYNNSTNSMALQTNGMGSNPSLFLDGVGRVAIGTGTTTAGAVLDLRGTGSSQSSLLLPRDSTANRHAGVNGMVRYNTSTNHFDMYEDGYWRQLVGGKVVGNSIFVGPFGGNSFTTPNGGNTSLGNAAMVSVTSGILNTAVGYTALNSNMTGSENVAVGESAGTSGNNLNFDGNTMVGTRSGIWVSSGSYNTLYGYRSGDTITTGINNIMIGPQANPPSATSSYRLNIGNAIYGDLTASNRQILISNAPTPTLNGAIFEVYGTGSVSAMIVPRDIQAYRPAGVNGMVRYNTNANKFEVFENGAWYNMATAGSGGADNLGNHVATQAIFATPGTAANPSYAFVGDPNTGIWKPGDDQLAVSTLGAERLRVTDLGWLGLGTTEPWNNFHIVDSYPGVAGIVIENPNTNSAAAATLDFKNDDNLTNFFQVGLSSEAAGGYGYLVSQKELYLNSDTSAITFATGGTERLRFAADGKTGIGTTTPRSELEIAGTGGLIVPRATNAQRPFGLNGLIRYNTTSLKFEVYEGRWQNMLAVGSGAADNLGNHTATQAILATPGTASTPGYAFNGSVNRGMWAAGTGGLAFSTGSTERLRIQSNGNVGIGTSTPIAQGGLHVHGSTFGVLKLTNTNSGATFTDGFDIYLSNTSVDLWNNENTPIRLSTAGTLRMVIEESGDVGIGTLSPASKLQVNGTISNVVSTTATYVCGNSLDFSTGNLQRLSSAAAIPGGACPVPLTNLVAGSSYTLIVTGPATTNAVRFDFANYSFKYLPANGFTTPGADTIYTFLYDGVNVYVNWSGGY